MKNGAHYPRRPGITKLATMQPEVPQKNDPTRILAGSRSFQSSAEPTLDV